MTIKAVADIEYVKKWKKHLAEDRGIVFRTEQERMEYVMRWVRHYFKDAQPHELYSSSWVDQNEKGINGLVDFESGAIQELEYCTACRKHNNCKKYCHTEGRRRLIRCTERGYTVDHNSVVCNFWRDEMANRNAYKQTQGVKGF